MPDSSVGRSGLGTPAFRATFEDMAVVEQAVEHGGSRCFGFGGLKAEQLVTAEILRAIAGDAIEAAIQAAEQLVTQRKERQRMVEMELEQARYEAQLASRRYESIDPANRLVARELEAR